MIELVIPYRSASIGSFDVRRVLPFRKRRSVGPFVFVDDFGPLEAVNDESLDVLAHPHIGLATVTYLFSGKMTHRDSIGSVQVIEPGEVNWMTAGRGIVHSERASDAGNVKGVPIKAVQTWVALPESHEESEPSFAHHDADELPVVEGDGVWAKVILGKFFGKQSPVVTVSNPAYAEFRLAAGNAVNLTHEIEERSVYILSGSLTIGGNAFVPGSLIVFLAGERVEFEAAEDSKFVFIGGDRLERPRFMWWNFVSTRNELIEQAQADWRDGNFKPIPNETGFVPLPEGNFPKAQPL
ncbi:MAG: pirin family protein [Pyrinomonadaceae bacterium]